MQVTVGNDLLRSSIKQNHWAFIAFSTTLHILNKSGLHRIQCYWPKSQIFIHAFAPSASNQAYQEHKLSRILGLFQKLNTSVHFKQVKPYLSWEKKNKSLPLKFSISSIVHLISNRKLHRLISLSQKTNEQTKLTLAVFVFEKNQKSCKKHIQRHAISIAATCVSGW